MTSFFINLFLLSFFSLMVFLSVKGKRSVVNALIIFHSINAVKILFLCVWSFHKTGTIYPDYLQFPDEYKYMAEWYPGTAFMNLYHLAVVGMKSIGFSILNIKMVNILLSSFAVVRLYTLKDWVRNKNQYVIHLLLFCGLLFLHVIYFSVFMLKDVVFFYVTAEYLIQLIQRPVGNRWLIIAFLCTLLFLIRRPMVVGLLVFLFDRNWKIRLSRVLLFVLLGVFLMVYSYAFLQQKFYRLVAGGLKDNSGVKWEGDIKKKQDAIKDAQRLVSQYPKAYMGHILINLRNVTSIRSQADLTIQLILFLEWCTVFYLLIIKKNLMRLIKWWPILIIALLYFTGGILTMYNIRYHIFPATILICLSVFVASQPIEGLSRSSGNGSGRRFSY